MLNLSNHLSVSKVGLRQSSRLAALQQVDARSQMAKRRQLDNSLGNSVQHAAQMGTRANLDLGGNRLRTARSLRPYLQGFAPPGTNRALRDAAGRTDPDFYRLFDKQSQPLTFQSNGLLLSCNLKNRSTQPISIVQLNKQGGRIPGSLATVQSGQSFSYPESLSQETFYLKVTSTAPGQNRYELNLLIINS